MLEDGLGGAWGGLCAWGTAELSCPSQSHVPDSLRAAARIPPDNPSRR